MRGKVFHIMEHVLVEKNFKKEKYLFCDKNRTSIPLIYETPRMLNNYADRGNPDS